MRKFNLTILFLLALLPVLFAGQTTRIPYRGIYADDPNGTAGIYNPERGCRKANYRKMDYPGLWTEILSPSQRNFPGWTLLTLG